MVITEQSSGRDQNFLIAKENSHTRTVNKKTKILYLEDAYENKLEFCKIQISPLSS